MINNVVQKTGMESQPIAEISRRDSMRAEEKKEEKVVNSEDLKKKDHDDIKAAMERIVNTAKFFNRKIHLELEKDLNIMIVKVIDEETDEVIRQIPPEEVIRLSKHAQDLKGLLIDKEG